jgi:hypothetical protein
MKKIVQLLAIALMLWGLVDSGAIASNLTPTEQLLTTGEIQTPSSSASTSESSELSPSSGEPLKTYFLTLAAENSRRRVNLDPPATRVLITSESGDTAVACGDGTKTYSCVPGKSLEITHELDAPIDYIWAQNSGMTHVRLRIDVYQ